MSEDKNTYLWILHGIKVINKTEFSPFILYVTSNEIKIYQLTCKKMLQDLINIFGKPKEIETNDELENDNVFINQQVVNAYKFYKNTERMVDGPLKGKLKLSWMDRYRRIDNIYEKLRSIDDKKLDTYYYIKKQELLF